MCQDYQNNLNLPNISEGWVGTQYHTKDLYEYLLRPFDGHSLEQEKESNMANQKSFMIEDGYYFDTYEEAEANAKRKLGGNMQCENWKIYQLLATVVRPVPTFEVVKATVTA